MWDISLFGGTTVTRSDTTVRGNALGGVKPRKLLEVLALTPGQAVSKDLLADRIWGDHPPRSYLATLESYVCVLRRSVGAPGGRGSWLATTPGGYILDVDQVRVDLHEIRHGLRNVAGYDTAVAVSMTSAALELDEKGLLLDSADEEWAADVRRHFAGLLVNACVHTAERSLAGGDAPAAIRFAHEALRRDPFAEPAVQVLLRGLSELGRRAEAMRVFRDFRQLLLDDLGIEPDPRTTAAYLDVLRRRPQQTDGPRSLESETRLLFDLLRQALETTGRLDFADTDLALRTLARELHAAA